MTLLTLTAIGTLAIALSSSTAHAQRHAWKEIGKTSSGNMVSVDPASIKRTNGLVAATVRIVFDPPVKASRGTWASSRTTATFNCEKKSLAAKENVFYSDVKGTKVVERKVNTLPGYGPALGGSLGAIALNYLCAGKS